MQTISIIFFCLINVINGHKSYEAQLYEDLLFDYNKIPRPVKNSSDVLMVDVGASLIRIIDVRWTDFKLKWDPKKYGGIKTLHIPSTEIWYPDFVLYNNAAGDPDITIFTDALVSHDGRVFWQPPAIYKSFCSKDEDGQDYQYMENGMDLSFFYKSAEWDLLSLTSARHSVLYPSCCGPEKYVDITYYFILRRKTLFFTCNLIIPCFLISVLTTFVFYLSDHKITFSISILVTLTVSVVTVNFRFRSGATHKMSPWIRTVFLVCLPKYLFSVKFIFFRLLFLKRQTKPVKSVLEKTPTSAMFADVSSSLTALCAQTAIIRPYEMEKPNGANNRSNSTIPRNRKIQAQTPISPALADLSYYRYPTPCGSMGSGSIPDLLNFPNKPERNNNFNNNTTIKSKFCKIPKLTSKKSFNEYELNNVSTFKSLPDTNMDTTVYRSNNNNLINNNSLPYSFQKKNTIKLDTNNPKKKINDLIFANLLRQVRFIAEHFKRNEEEAEISDDWTFVALVMDRLFLYIFALLNFGTLLILLKAPSLYDQREPLNVTVPTRPLGQANLFNIHSV